MAIDLQSDTKAHRRTLIQRGKACLNGPIVTKIYWIGSPAATDWRKNQGAPPGNRLEAL